MVGARVEPPTACIDKRDKRVEDGRGSVRRFEKLNDRM